MYSDTAEKGSGTQKYTQLLFQVIQKDFWIIRVDGGQMCLYSAELLAEP